MTDIETLKRAVRRLQGETMAMRAIMPSLVAHIAVAYNDDPDMVIRDIHKVAQSALDKWPIEGDEDLAVRIRETASVHLDGLLASIRLTKLDPEQG